MNREERKRKKLRKKRLKFVFFGFILIYLLARSLPSLGDKTVLPEEYLVEDIINTEAIVIMNERVYTSDAEGQLAPIATEGERIPAGTKVAELNLLDDNSTLNQKLQEIDKRIESLSKANSTNDTIDNSEEESDIVNLIADIRNNISDENYYEVGILGDKLSTLHENKLDVNGDDKLIDYSLESLEEQRNDLLNQITNNTIDCISEEAGVLSYKIDGYEGTYSIIGESDFKYSDFEKIGTQEANTREDDNYKVGDPIFKVINNFTWYMIVKIENIKDIDNYEIGNNIILSSQDAERDLQGKIKKITKEGNKGTIICEFNEDFNSYYDKRHIDIDIVKSRYDSYKIPKKSLVEKDGLKGVYINDIKGIIRFRPIEILKEDDDSLYISIGDKDSEIKVGNDENVKTVGEFDEIILNPSKFEDGMIYE